MEPKTHEFNGRHGARIGHQPQGQQQGERKREGKGWQGKRRGETFMDSINLNQAIKSSNLYAMWQGQSSRERLLPPRQELRSFWQKGPPEGGMQEPQRTSNTPDDWREGDCIHHKPALDMFHMLCQQRRSCHEQMRTVQSKTYHEAGREQRGDGEDHDRQKDFQSDRGRKWARREDGYWHRGRHGPRSCGR